MLVRNVTAGRDERRRNGLMYGAGERTEGGTGRRAGSGYGAWRERVAAAIRCADRPWMRGLFFGKTRR